MLSNQLKYRAVLYAPDETAENDLGEIATEPVERETFWCSIKPTNGRVDRSLPGEVAVEEVTNRIEIRMKASKLLRKPGGRQHTYLLIDGVRYDVMYVLPQYQTRDRMVIYAKVRAD